MKTARHPSKEFRTPDLYLSTALRALGFPILRVENNGKRAFFVFLQTEELDAGITSFFNRELSFEPLFIFETWKNLRSLAHAHSRSY